MTACYQLRKIGLPASVEKVKNLYRLTSSTTTIGRGQTVDIFLDSNIRKGLISRSHAQIIEKEGENGEIVYLMYDTSLNGTYVNDIRVDGSVILNDGDTIAFGHLCGSNILPGALGPQKETEFLFKFEKCLNPKMKDEPVDLTLKELHNSASSVFMSPKSPLSGNGVEMGGLNQNLCMTEHIDKSKKYCSLNPSIKGDLTKETLRSEKVEYGNLTPNVQSCAIPKQQSSFSSDTTNQNRHILYQQKNTMSPVKLIHPRNKVVPLSSKIDSHRNLENDISNVPFLDKSGLKRKGSEGAYSKGSDIEIQSGSESEYIDSDSDSGKSLEIPDDSSDNEYVPQGKQTKKNLPEGYGKKKDNIPIEKKLHRQNMVYNNQTPGKRDIEETIIQRKQINTGKSQKKRKGSNKTNEIKDQSQNNHYTHDKCDAPNCKIPPATLKTITWICCDDCDAWYHVSCSGLTVVQAKKKDTIFRCGCS